MAPSICRAFPQGIKRVATLAFIFSLTILLPRSVGSLIPSYGESGERQREMAVGSRPPACVNKCFNCRPCMATLVIPTHQMKRLQTKSRGEDSDSYYLLSWKCRCGNKLFQP
ncbi:hypothetical protein FNV43_RR06972 [Rhamnella rubrinervis]|uniref:Epidermal patterning factor-like protein n=1 Tax=Rhamnella rubrinervis TaxID=2594499 RepID=A0A8K0HFN1_9ROSA|nr:hypothetical protein FNV43_RR06972 [Rhamnella rubrinervis]